MANFAQLALAALSLAGVRARVRYAAVSAGFTAAGGIVCLSGLAFLVAALWLFIAQNKGALAANLWIGFGLLLIGLVLAQVGRLRAPPSAVHSDAAPLADISESEIYKTLVSELDKQFRKKGAGLKSTAIIAAVGFVIGRMLRR